ncbi:MAG: helix-turn-helix domain-containing protein [Prevotella sp.]|nr:helix-turn-helix domain-containing protein [Prevotella sp.]
MRKIGILIYYIILCWRLTVSAQPQCTVTHYDEFSGMAQWYVTQIVQDQQGMMWFATWNGLNRYDGYQFECFKSQVGDGIDMPSDRIQDMLLDDDGNLLCLVEDRVFGFDVKSCRYYALSKNQENIYIARFQEKTKKEIETIHPPYLHTDPYGIEWAIHKEGSLSYRQQPNGPWIPYHLEMGIGQDVYYCITDKEENVWFKSHYGAYRLSFKKKNYTIFPQEKPTLVRFFYLDQKQRYWVMTKEDATIRIFDASNNLLGYLGRDGKLHEQYTSFGSPIYCMTQDANGQYWLGSKPDGLFRLKEPNNGVFNISQFRHEQGNRQSLQHNHIFDVKTDKQGRLWVATFDGGLNCIENPYEESPRFLHKDNGLQLPKEDCLRVRQIHITNKGILLAATTTGLLVADIGKKNLSQVKWHHHLKDSHRSSSLSNNATMYVAEDNQNRIFVCTESGGVNQIVSQNLLDDRLEFKHYRISDGFPSDVALSAYATDDFLVIVSNNQLIQLFPDKEGTDMFRTYFWKDRLRFSDANPIRLPDGRYIFGLQNGSFTIRREDLMKSTFVPPIALTGISIENRPILHAINSEDSLVLQPNERNFTLYFSALDYSDVEDISYSFLMESGKGGDSWNNIGKNHSATFLDLRPGTYLLRIRSTNSDGVWVDNERTLTVIVKPTFWETRWAQLLYLLLTGLVIWGILYTHQYIQDINRKQRETHEAYLALLNSQGSLKVQQDMVQTPTESAPKLKPEDDAFMRRTMKFIEEHISDPDINIGDLAEATATSRSGLNRKMKSLLGVTPLDFIREARIHKACQLLKEGLAVNDTAYNCGFSDPKYFAKCFKAETGMTPKEYKVENCAN